MQKLFVVVPALVLAGCAATQNERPDPMEPRAMVPPVEFRSAFADYRPFAEGEMLDWRKANDEVGAAGGHGGHK